MNILIVNGCNLNMLGHREPSIYGNQTYSDLKKFIKELSKDLKFSYKMIQSNYEGKLIDAIQKAPKNFDAIIINPGAFTHYSYGIRDAISGSNLKCIEVHLSDITNREDFRKYSVIKEVCIDQIYGKQFDSYKLAIEKIMEV